MIALSLMMKKILFLGIFFLGLQTSAALAKIAGCEVIIPLGKVSQLDKKKIYHVGQGEDSFSIRPASYSLADQSIPKLFLSIDPRKSSFANLNGGAPSVLRLDEVRKFRIQARGNRGALQLIRTQDAEPQYAIRARIYRGFSSSDYNEELPPDEKPTSCAFQ